MISNLSGSGSVQIHQKKAVFIGSQFRFDSTPYREVWKSVGGDFFLEKCLGGHCNINIVFALQLIATIPN